MANSEDEDAAMPLAPDQVGRDMRALLNALSTTNENVAANHEAIFDLAARLGPHIVEPPEASQTGESENESEREAAWYAICLIYMSNKLQVITKRTRPAKLSLADIVDAAQRIGLCLENTKCTQCQVDSAVLGTSRGAWLFTLLYMNSVMRKKVESLFDPEDEVRLIEEEGCNGTEILDDRDERVRTQILSYALVPPPTRHGANTQAAVTARADQRNDEMADQRVVSEPVNHSTGRGKRGAARLEATPGKRAKKAVAIASTDEDGSDYMRDSTIVICQGRVHDVSKRAKTAIVAESSITMVQKKILQDNLRKAGAEVVDATKLCSADDVTKFAASRQDAFVVTAYDSLNPYKFVEQCVKQKEALDALISSDKIQFKKVRWLQSCLEEKRIVEGGNLITSATQPRAGPASVQAHADEDSDSEKELRFVQKKGDDDESRLDHKGAVLVEFERIRDMYETLGEDYRFRVYEKAILAIEQMKSPLLSVDDVKDIHNIGISTEADIGEIIRWGRCKRLNRDERVSVIQLFTGIYDVGPASARAWYNKGWRTLRDVEEHSDELSRNQKIGRKYYYDLEKRIPRNEVQQAESIVRRHVREMSEGKLDALATGSYRRGEADSGDIDIIVHGHPDDLCGVIEPLLQRLEAEKFVVERLTASETDMQKHDHFGVFMLISKLPDVPVHHRLDILMVADHNLGVALVYFTGPTGFNRALRLRAKRLMFKLSNHDLRRIDHAGEACGDPILLRSEEEVFKTLGLDFLAPEERKG